MTRSTSPNSTGATPTTPSCRRDLRPPGYAGYDWACFGIGVSLTFIGIGRTGRAASAKPETWTAAEV